MACAFSHAIVRSPGHSIAHGLRAHDAGNPDPGQFDLEHRGYIGALERAGVAVDVLPAWEQFPDSVFIEDTAVTLGKGAVILRPGADTRTGESAAMGQYLKAYYDDVRQIDDPGFIEGGDILVTDKEIIVGLSARTDRAGAEALKACVADWGYAVRVLQTPRSILHFKTACGLVDEETILLTPELAALNYFAGYRTLMVPRGEEAAANAIAVNDRVFVSAGYPKTADLLTDSGHSVVTLATGEAAKVDGGLSCMSLRFG